MTQFLIGLAVLGAGVVVGSREHIVIGCILAFIGSVLVVVRP